MNYRLLRIFAFSLSLILYAFIVPPSFCMDGAVNFLTPNSYELSRYGSTPVNICQGTPSVNIPLTSISDRDLSVDVSLSYMATGIKVDQEATSFGLGWTLNAGGVITRTVRGRPDQYDNKGVWNPRRGFEFNKYNSDWDKYIKNNVNDISLVAEYSDDVAADIFSMNFCGHSGSFYLDKTAKGRMNDYQDLSIEYIDGPNKDYFKITDEHGVIYIFDQTEDSYTSSFGWFPVAWYLSSITSPTGEKLTLSYIEERVSGHERRTYDKCFIKIKKDVPVYVIGGLYTTHQSTWEYETKALLLSQIESSAGARIEFLYDKETRKDVCYSGHKLNQIIHTNSLGEVIKHWKLSYGYFEAASNRRLEGNRKKLYLNYRLKLAEIQEISTNGKESLPPYKFVYYGDDGKYEHLLPYRLSCCQDYWGYYNGKNNTSMFPGASGYFETEFTFMDMYDILGLFASKIYSPTLVSNKRFKYLCVTD